MHVARVSSLLMMLALLLSRMDIIAAGGGGGGVAVAMGERMVVVRVDRVVRDILGWFLFVFVCIGKG